MTGFEVDPDELRAVAGAVAASVPTVTEQAAALHAAAAPGTATPDDAYTDAAATLHRLVVECAARLEAVATGLAADAARYAAAEDETVRGIG